LSDKAQIFVFFGLMVSGLLPMAAHIKTYKQLIRGLKRKYPLESLDFEYPLSRLYSSSGAIPHLNFLLSKYSHCLTSCELTLIGQSKKLYYLSGVYTLTVFFSFITFKFWFEL
jgi:hypothetical protein